MFKVEDYREYYNLYFKEFNRLAVGEYAGLSYGTDEPNATSSSLESIIAYANYILKSGSAKWLLNAGSGASSWMFRKLFDRVVCIDPNERYNDLVELICSKNGLDSDNFYTSFDIQNRFPFNHVFYDFGNIERLPYLGSAIDIAIISVYCDDTDCRDDCKPYREHVYDLCKAMKLKCFDCVEALDEHGRYGVIIEK